MLMLAIVITLIVLLVAADLKELPRRASDRGARALRVPLDRGSAALNPPPSINLSVRR